MQLVPLQRGGGMKNRKHWNSFASNFFVDASVGYGLYICCIQSLTLSA
jgi:hypothetical protein